MFGQKQKHSLETLFEIHKHRFFNVFWNQCTPKDSLLRRRGLLRPKSFEARNASHSEGFAPSKKGLTSPEVVLTRRAPLESKKCFALGLKIQGTLRRSPQALFESQRSSLRLLRKSMGDSKSVSALRRSVSGNL